MTSTPDPGAVAAPVAAALDEARTALPFEERTDEATAVRGLVAPFPHDAVLDADGRAVWDLRGYAFLEGEPPSTVHPSLWRQGRLVNQQGLFEVVPGIYQVRGLDLSNITFVEGDEGVLVVDPLISVETAKAALDLYREHRGSRRVVGVVYSHSHLDHFGGVKGVTTQADVDTGLCRVIAPQGFTEHAVAENVYAGTAMGRRAGYMYGAALDKGPRGQVGAGLGQTTSTGRASLILPTDHVTRTGQALTVDGIRMEFQLTPGTEAPAEMNFYFPDHRALCMAENATHTLHNLLTLRGALVRDPRVWAAYLTEAIDLFAERSDVVFASHHWPTWGSEELTRYLSEQRDLYAYLHDQTLRLLNQGYVGTEIAEMLAMPPALQRAWHTHGYYGSVSHNVKAIYQRYMGWFDGNPAHLWEHPPQEAARRYVDWMGGADQVVGRARTSYDEGDLRWVVTVLNHVLFAEPDHAGARELQATAYEQLGYGSENGTWRNFFLSGAEELRHGSFGTPTTTASADLVAALTAEQLFDALAISVDGPRAWDADLALDWLVDGARHRVTLRNGVLVHRQVADDADTDSVTATFASAMDALTRVATGQARLEDLVAAGEVTVRGDPMVWDALTVLLDRPDPDFAIVLP
jgi:alkyl sulfatase BDS1-like metallo-beta-lactamase superfamily hydrolase